MKHGITGLDHPVIAVADMQTARAAYERLGFTVPPRGRHREWGTGNWCIMFPDDYLELRGIIDPARYLHGLDTYLATRGEGLMGVAFGTDSALESHRELAASGFHPQPVKHLTRLFELPEGVAEPSFELCFLPLEETPALGLVVFCQHLTPQIIRRSDWLRHPNGAIGIRSLWSASQEAEAFRAIAPRLFGQVAAAGDAVSVRLPRGCELRVGDAVQKEESVIALNVENLARTSAYFEASGIPHRQTGTRIRIEPQHCCGVALEFQEA